MRKRLIAGVLCIAGVVLSSVIGVRADSFIPLNSGTYVGYGQCGIAATSAWAQTSINTYTEADFYGDYVYIRNYGTTAADVVVQPISAGGLGGCYKGHNITSDDRSDYIDVWHRIKNSAGIIVAQGGTRAEWLTK